MCPKKKFLIDRHVESVTYDKPLLALDLQSKAA